MATIANTSDSAALNAALDQEFVKNFQGDATRLMEILGIFGLITSQIDTAPKPLAQNPHCKGRSNLTGEAS